MTDMTASNVVTRFSYTAQDVTYAGVRFGRAGARARILLMPDGEGMNSGWAAGISQRYADTCGAEVILTDHYGIDQPHPSFDEAGVINQRLYRDPVGARALFKHIVAALAPHWTGDGPLLVVGFCSGGAFAFETGRSGAPVDAVFSVHGNPASGAPLAACGRHPVFAMVHGSLDPFISQAALASFSREMQDNKIDWRLHVMGGAKHSFTRFDRTVEHHGMAYSQRAEIDSRHLVLAQIASLLEQRQA